MSFKKISWIFWIINTKVKLIWARNCMWISTLMRGRGLCLGQAAFGFIPERNVHGLWRLSCLVNMVGETLGWRGKGDVLAAVNGEEEVAAVRLLWCLRRWCMTVCEDEFWENEEENEGEVTTCFERYYNATRPTS
jgi:hypothetical protein